MAQTGYTPILLYSSNTVSQAPSASNLTNSTLGSELAINITDGKLFYKDDTNAVQVIAWKVTPTTAGGTGLTSYTAGDLLYYASGTTLTKLAIGASGRWLGSSGTAPQWNAPAALTKTDDTNVTLTLGGSASTALLNAASLTLGWTGTLAVSRGGTGTGTAFTAGSVVFAGASGVYSQDNANLFWDDTNNRLGIGTASPQSALSFASGSVIGIATVDGSDNGVLALAGGGTAASTRGGFIEVRGNEATIAGLVDITSGNVANSYVSIQGRSSSSYIRFATNATEAMRIFSSQGVSIGDTTDPSAGNLRLGTGNLVIGTSGKGIDFSATAGTGTSELLADYEEGTWTPELVAIGGSFTANPTYTTQTGTYTKIGRFVYCNFVMTLSNKGTTTGGPFPGIGGFPFTVGAGIGATGCLYFDVLAINWIWVGLQPRASNTNGYLIGSKAAAAATSYFATSNADLNNTTTIQGNFMYAV